MVKYWVMAFVILVIILFMYVFLNTSLIQDTLSTSPIIPEGLLTKNKIESKECFISLQPPQNLKIQFEETQRSCTLSTVSNDVDDHYYFTLSGRIANWEETTNPYLETGTVTTIGGKEVFFVPDPIKNDITVEDMIFIQKGDFVYSIVNSYNENGKNEMYLESILSSLKFTGSENDYLQVTN